MFRTTQLVAVTYILYSTTKKVEISKKTENHFVEYIGKLSPLAYGI